MWIFDKLFNRKIEGKSSLDSLQSLADRFNLDLANHEHFYIIFDSVDGLKIVDTVPEDYDDYVMLVSPASIKIGAWANGDFSSDNTCDYTDSGSTKIDFPALTHSLNELDPLLKQLIEDAITTQEEVACSQEQWNAIKHLLDKSLYLNYNGYSLIKSYFEGINEYHFGGMSGEHGEELYFHFDTGREMLFVDFNEV